MKHCYGMFPFFAKGIEYFNGVLCGLDKKPHSFIFELLGEFWKQCDGPNEAHAHDNGIWLSFEETHKEREIKEVVLADHLLLIVPPDNEVGVEGLPSKHDLPILHAIDGHRNY